MKPFQHDPGLVSPLEVGAEVRDRKRPAPGHTGAVVDALEATADEFVVDAIDCTVAEDNPAYPPTIPSSWRCGTRTNAENRTTSHSRGSCPNPRSRTTPRGLFLIFSLGARS